MASSVYRKTALLLWADLTDRQGCDIDVDAITEAEIIVEWERILERALSASSVVQRQCECEDFKRAQLAHTDNAGDGQAIWYGMGKYFVGKFTISFCPFCGGNIVR